MHDSFKPQPKFQEVQMPTPKSPSIFISEAQKNILEQITRRSTAAQREVKRAKLILEIGLSGAPNTQISKRFEISRDTVIRWRYKWLSYEAALEEIENPRKEDRQKDLKNKILEILDDAPRSGAPSKFTPEQYCRILAVALEPPENSDRPITHWTDRELADECQKRKIVESISPRQVGRFLKRSGHQTACEPILA